MLGQRGDERSVLRREHREIRRAIRRLGRLIVALDDVRREAVQLVPVSREPLTEAHGAGFRAPRRVQARFEDCLRQSDFGRHPEALVNRAPLLQKPAVAARVRQQKLPSGRVVHHRPGGLLEESCNLLAPLIEALGQPSAIQDRRERGILPVGIARPIAGGRNASTSGCRGPSSCSRARPPRPADKSWTGRSADAAA